MTAAKKLPEPPVTVTDAWPAVLRRLAALVGPELALRLADAQGGQDRTYIPKAATEGHPWRGILGDDAWRRVVEAWGGERIDLPRGVYLTLRKAQIIELHGTGISHREIARRTRVGERYVRRVLEGLGPPTSPKQQRLF